MEAVEGVEVEAMGGGAVTPEEVAALSRRLMMMTPWVKGVTRLCTRSRPYGLGGVV